MFKKILSVVNLLRDIIVSPIKVFERINKDQLSFEVYIIFLLGALVTFLRTLRLEGQSIHFFETERINKVLSFLAVPQIKWGFTYITFFLFILILYLFSKIFLKRIRPKPLFLCLMSISGVGLIMQALFFVFHYIFSQNVNFFLTYIAFAWVVILSLLAIKCSQEISIGKSLFLFVIAGLPTIFIAGLTGISPYLAWMAL